MSFIPEKLEVLILSLGHQRIRYGFSLITREVTEVGGGTVTTPTTNPQKSNKG